MPSWPGQETLLTMAARSAQSESGVGMCRHGEQYSKHCWGMNPCMRAKAEMTWVSTCLFMGLFAQALVNTVTG